jgi:hypothetical protein
MYSQAVAKQTDPVLSRLAARTRAYPTSPLRDVGPIAHEADGTCENAIRLEIARILREPSFCGRPSLSRRCSKQLNRTDLATLASYLAYRRLPRCRLAERGEPVRQWQILPPAAALVRLRTETCRAG